MKPYIKNFNLYLQLILFIAFSSLLYLPLKLKNGIWSGILFTAATMTRPDGVLFFALSASYLFFVSVKLKQWKSFMAFVLTFALLFGTYFLCHFEYYNQLLPNTFYAKTNFTQMKFSKGLRYASRFAGSITLVMIALAFLFWKNLNLIKAISSKSILQ